MEEKKYGFILIDEKMHIQKARSQCSYEDTLDAQLIAARYNWVYVPLGMGELIDELSKMEIYE